MMYVRAQDSELLQHGGSLDQTLVWSKSDFQNKNWFFSAKKHYTVILILVQLLNKCAACNLSEYKKINFRMIEKNRRRFFEEQNFADFYLK